MKKLSLSLVCICALFLSTGCSFLSTVGTPAAVTDAVARGYTVSKASLQTPPTTEQEMTAYHEINHELWKQIAIWYELLPAEETE